MGFWGKLVGGAIGGAVGGPLGVAAGVAFGSILDAGMEEEAPQALQAPSDLGAELQFLDDPDGRFFVVTAPLPQDGVVLVARLITADGTRYLRPRAQSFADDDGDLAILGRPTGEGWTFYLPFGVVQSHEGEPESQVEIVALGVQGDDSVVPFGRQVFHWTIPTTASWSEVLHWRPLVGLCMAVARADGKLLREEIQAIRGIVQEGLNIPPSENDGLRALLKEEPSGSIDELVTWMNYRFPEIELQAILGALCDVARADQEVAGSEVQVIREVAIAFGLDPDEWPSLAEALELEAGDDTRARHLELLGLESNATKKEIRTAYRRTVAQYHPDRVINLPTEFKQLATRKTIELREAYESLTAS
jgi:DnaJ like chaperone protein